MFHWIVAVIDFFEGEISPDLLEKSDQYSNLIFSKLKKNKNEACLIDVTKTPFLSKLIFFAPV